MDATERTDAATGHPVVDRGRLRDRPPPWEWPKVVNLVQLTLSAPLWFVVRPRSWFSAADFPSTAALASAGVDVAAELRAMIHSTDLAAVQQVDRAQRHFNRDADWEVLVLRIYGREVSNRLGELPTLMRLLREHPDIVSVAVSAVGPGKRIPWHPGMYKGLLRAHLGVEIPDGECWMQVGRSRRGWRAGEVLVFDDTIPHRVVNDTDRRRVVLMVEIFRPMPFEWLDRRNARFVDWLSRRWRIDHIERRNAAERSGTSTASR